METRALEAARLAKADQVSIMVREFADLEGTMGQTYARLEGFPEEVAQAIREQFLPDAAEGVLPETVSGSLLATAEKIDNIVAAFACGERPRAPKIHTVCVALPWVWWVSLWPEVLLTTCANSPSSLTGNWGGHSAFGGRSRRGAAGGGEFVLERVARG